MIVIEKLKVLNDVLNKKSKMTFILSFVASQNAWTTKFLKNVFICKEAFGALFGIDCKGLKALAKHVVLHTLPIHVLFGRVTSTAVKFRENMLPPVTFFNNEILPMACVRLRFIFPVPGERKNGGEFPYFWEIGEFPEYSPFSFPGNIAFKAKKSLKVDRSLPFSGPLRKINWQLKSSQRDRSFKPKISDFGRKKNDVSFFLSLPFQKER